MIAWISALFIGPLLAGFAVYLCRGARQDRRLAREQIAEWQILAEIERLENLRLSRRQRHVNPARLISGPRVPLTLTAVSPGGMRHRPVWGPETHGGSNWSKPGQEWGAGYVFTSPGCWDLHADRGSAYAAVWIRVVKR